MTPDDPNHANRTRFEIRLMWMSVVVLTIVLAVGVAVVLHQNPTLTSDIWPDQTNVPRPVP